MNKFIVLLIVSISFILATSDFALENRISNVFLAYTRNNDDLANCNKTAADAVALVRKYFTVDAHFTQTDNSGTDQTPTYLTNRTQIENLYSGGRSVLTYQRHTGQDIRIQINKAKTRFLVTDVNVVYADLFYTTGVFVINVDRFYFRQTDDFDNDLKIYKFIGAYEVYKYTDPWRSINASISCLPYDGADFD